MKNIGMIICMLILGGSQLHGQKLREWIRQKKTQKEYLIQQLLANQLLIDALKKGYQVTQYGLHWTWQINQQESALHQLFFDGLKQINPSVLRFAEVGELMHGAVHLIENAQEYRDYLRQEGGVDPAQSAYVARVYEQIIRQAENFLSELLVLTLADQLELTDDARIARIGRLHGEMEELYSVFRRFSAEAIGIHGERKRRREDIQAMQKWYDINAKDHGK